MREPPACPLKFATAVRKKGEKRVRRVPRPLQPSFGHRPTSTVLRNPPCPISLADAQKAGFGNFHGRSDKRGCIGTVEVGLWPKLLNIRRRRRQLDFLSGYRRPPRTSAGQPAALTAPTHIDIRVSDADRHENHNR
jgi:hypothetical protein